MKKFYKLILMAALALGAAPFIASCSDDDKDDEWNATYVYIQREDYLVGNTKTFNLTHDAEGIGGDEVTMAFTAKTQKPTHNDIIVNLKVTSGSEDLKVENIKISSTQAVIKAGEQTSEEITVTVDRNMFNSIKDKTSYSFDVAITDIETNNGNTFISNNGLLTKIPAVINKSAYCNLKSGTPADSKLWTAKSEWKFTIQEGVENQNSNSVIGNGGSDIATNGVAFWLTVDLNAVKTVKGIQTKHWGSSYAPTQVEIFYSEDGRTWNSMGELDTKGGTQNISFIAPVQTRYLKYQMLKVPGRVDMTAFYVYIAAED